jgi:hypothetical protein
MRLSLLLILGLLSIQLSAKESLLLIENVGQVTDQHYNARPDISYMLRAGGLNVFAGSAALHYQFRSPSSDVQKKFGRDRKESSERSSIDMYRMDVELVGANKAAIAIAEQRNGYYEQYFTQAFGDEGGLAHSYSKITYKDVYPNIDWVLYIKNEKLEYDFVVRPGGNPADIQLKYGGATSLSIGADGGLTATTPMGSIAEGRPVSYANGKTVASAYKLNGTTISFDIAQYSGTLVIDPLVEWTSGYSGSGYDDGAGVAADGQGNSYLMGETEGGNVATTGAYQGTYAGLRDAFLMKLNATGTKVWGTFFGGPDEEQAFDVQYDNVGAVVIYGLTRSLSGIASTGAHQTTGYGNIVTTTAYLGKFSLTGSRLWSTYYGGPGGENWGSISCDQSGNIYMSGSTGSTTNISTAGAHQENLSTGGTYDIDGFLVKFNGSGVRQWATYYGGDGPESAYGVACDHSGNVFLGGITSSNNNISTGGAFQTTLSALTNGFLVKFNANGIRQWGTYFKKAIINGLGCDLQGNVFLTGTTKDVTLATTGAYQVTLAGGTSEGDGFLAKFDPLGSRLWTTFLGGPEDEYLERVICNSLGFVYVMGNTFSSSGVATANAYRPTYSGGIWDGIFAKFDNNGGCMWSSYYGDQQNWACYDIAFENATTFYMSGLNQAPGGGAFITKFHDYPNSVEEVINRNASIQAYPNPNKGIFSIKGEWGRSQNADIKVYDVTGKCVYQNTVTTQNDMIGLDLHNLIKSGVYFLKVHTGNKNYATSVVVE